MPWVCYLLNGVGVRFFCILRFMLYRCVWRCYCLLASLLFDACLIVWLAVCVLWFASKV